MKILFIGAVEFSRRCLLALWAAGHDPDVLTVWEAEGRQRHCDWADLSVGSPRGVLYEGSLPNIKGQYDLALVCGWSRLLPLDLAPVMVGSHPTLLPKGRGRHPIPWALILGLEQTGLSFFHLSEEPDAGDLRTPTRSARRGHAPPPGAPVGTAERTPPRRRRGSSPYRSLAFNFQISLRPARVKSGGSLRATMPS